MNGFRCLREASLWLTSATCGGRHASRLLLESDTPELRSPRWRTYATLGSRTGPGMDGSAGGLGRGVGPLITRQ